MTGIDHRAEAERLAEYADSSEAADAYDQHKSILLANAHASLAIADALRVVGKAVAPSYTTTVAEDLDVIDQIVNVLQEEIGSTNHGKACALLRRFDISPRAGA